MLFLRPNRKAQAWWLLAPILAYLIFASTAAQLGGWFRAANIGLFVTFVGAPLALLWSGAFLLIRQRKLASLGAALLIAIIALIYQSVLPGMGLMTAMPVAVIIAGEVITLVLARRFSGAAYRPVRFTFFFALSLIIITSAVTLVFAVVETATSGEDFAEIVQALGPALFVAACLFCCMLPFLLLSFWCPFYRERFCRVLRIGVGTKDEKPEEEKVPEIAGV